MSFDFPYLQRPQYPSSPEILLSTLAWSVIPRHPDHVGTGLMYLRKTSSARRGVRIDQTMPQGDALVTFFSALQAHGMTATNGLPLFAAAAAANSYLGIPPEKGVGWSSSAVGLAGALLQDAVGGLAVANPPNFAHVVNTMYKLGGGIEASAATRWFEAAMHFSRTSKLRTIEGALATSTLAPYLAQEAFPPDQPTPSPASVPGPLPAWWLRDVVEKEIGTPFTWFHTSWNRLCSPAWYGVLPPRRWAAWAVCLLRNAIGFSYLWEANFFAQLARGVIDQGIDIDTAVRRALKPASPLVPYRRGGTISQLDVMPSMKSLLKQGLACRAALLNAVRDLRDTPADLRALIEALRNAPQRDGASQVREALGGAGYVGGLSNLEETVKYSLLARGSAEIPDHFALLRTVSRRFTHVAPGPEWIVVMAAMAADKPTSVVRLGDVQRALESLCFQPRIDFLLEELERAGLCASAPDGDEGIELNLGFGG